jgi:class 3 adenylate cyclase
VATVPPIEYAHSGHVHIAYQVSGRDAGRDLLLVPGIYSQIELMWEEPAYAEFLRRLGQFARLIAFDMRGIGLSDRAEALPTLEEQVDDVLAVLDAARSDRAAILGISQGGPMSALFAALHPERTSSLILYGAYATAMGDADYPWGRSPEWLAWYFDEIEKRWGHGAFIGALAPSRAEDPAFRAWWSRFERNASAPGNTQAYVRTHSRDDVRAVLQAIRVPTLVIQRSGDRFRDPRNGAYLAAHIPGSTYVELAGDDHLVFLGDRQAVADEIEGFVTGARRGPDLDRVLATVLFTDIVESTQMARRMGDAAWRQLLERHNTLVREQIELHRGVEVDTTGDGFLITFDGPARAVRCAIEVQAALAAIGIEVRAGAHTGEVEMAGRQIRGVAVHIGARIAALAGPGEILTSRTVRDLVAGSSLSFTDRGMHALKGIDEPVQLFRATGDPVPG